MRAARHGGRLGAQDRSNPGSLMRDTQLFQLALGINSPWFVAASEFDAEKKKLDIEPIELDDDRPRRRREVNEATASSAELLPPPPMPRRTNRAPADPLFDKPYEPDPNADPVWEGKTTASAAAGSASSLSRFIKPKRKVAALLGGSGGAKPSTGN